MLPPFSTQYLTPDDFSVSCRLRRNDEFSASTGDVDSYITCTMRKWHKEAKNASEFKSPLRRKLSKSQSMNHDAELIIAPSQCHGPVLNGGELSKIAETNTPIPLSKRFASFGTPDFIDAEERAQYQQTWSDSHQSGSLSSLKDQCSLHEDVTIPVNDIIKVITRGEEDGGQRRKRVRKRSGTVSKKDSSPNDESRQQPTICITTSSTGSYELMMESTNEQLVVVTFLKANSKKGEVVFETETGDEHKNDIRDDEPKGRSKNQNTEKKDIIGESSQDDAKESMGTGGYESMVIESNASNLTHGTSQSTGERSFDVEAFTAKKMNERLETESVVEKLERRMLRLFASLEDLSSSLTNCTCGCFGDTALDNTVTIGREKDFRPRKNTASTASLSDSDRVDGDTDLNVTDVQNVDKKTKTVFRLAPEVSRPDREELLTVTQLPSGLSVESKDPFLDEEIANEHSSLLQSYLPPPVPVMASDV